jgi:MFS family permease
MALGFGGLALISVFIRPLEAEFGWSRGELSFAYGVATIGMALGGMVWGRVSNRLDIRILLATGGSGMALSLFAMAAVQSLWQIYLANLVLSGFGFAVLYAPLLSATGEWFDRRRGLAVGVVTAGGALGQGVLPFLANILIDNLGWRLAFFGLAIVTLIALALTLPYVRRPDGAQVCARIAAYVTVSSPPAGQPATPGRHAVSGAPAASASASSPIASGICRAMRWHLRSRRCASSLTRCSATASH